MKNKKYKVIILFTAFTVGISTILIALSMDILLPEFSQRIGHLKYIFVGLGSGIMGATASKLITQYAYKKDPQLAKQAKINENDERYITIRTTAAYYMWYITLFLICAMSLVFVILDIIIAVCISLAVMAIHIVVYFMLMAKVSKKI